MHCGITLDVTSVGYPLEITGTVAGRPIWYRARGSRWELYETALGVLEHATVDHDSRHFVGTGVQFLAEGSCGDGQDTDLLFALERIGAATRDWTIWAQWWATTDGVRLTPEYLWSEAFARDQQHRIEISLWQAAQAVVPASAARRADSSCTPDGGRHNQGA